MHERTFSICVMSAQYPFKICSTVVVFRFPKMVDHATEVFCAYTMNNYIYSTLFKIQERKSDRRSKEIEQRKESQSTHIKQGRTCDLTALTLNAHCAYTWPCAIRIKYSTQLYIVFSSNYTNAPFCCMVFVHTYVHVHV